MTDERTPDIRATVRNVAARLRGILAPCRWQVGAIVLLILLTSLLEGASFSLLVPVTQAVTRAAAPNGPPLMFGVYDALLKGATTEGRLAVLGLAMVVLFGLKNGTQYLREVLSARLCTRIGAETRVKVLEAVLRRPYRYFLDRKQGALVQQLYHEPHHVAYLVQTVTDQGANLLAVLVLVGLLLLVSWQVTLFILAAGLLFGATIWWLSGLVERGGRSRQEVEAEAMALLSETVGGIRQIKVFSAEERLLGVYAGWVQKFRRLHTRYTISLTLPHHVTELFWVTILGLLLALPYLGLLGTAYDVWPVVAVFAAVAFRVGPYLSRISQGWLTLRFYLPALTVVEQLLDRPQPSRSAAAGRSFSTLSRGIRFEDVSFTYGGDKLALDRVTVEFRRGAITAIVGPSGAGKSTLVDLLVRLYEPSSGRIMVDGVDLREYDRESWLAAIGFVSQDTFIFHGTIRDNIAFSQPGCSMDQVERAARLANAHVFIQGMPDGYDTVVGDRGLRLSGGERQRLAIARALLRDPQVVIFDEATSALDNQSEALIQQTIAEIARERTLILIAHRLSTVIGADTIIALDHGRVAEVGTHATLLRERGLYANLYSRESS